MLRLFVLNLLSTYKIEGKTEPTTKTKDDAKPACRPSSEPSAVIHQQQSTAIDSHQRPPSTTRPSAPLLSDNIICLSHIVSPTSVKCHPFSKVGMASR
jgi:hypothetical protein